MTEFAIAAGVNTSNISVHTSFICFLLSSSRRILLPHGTVCCIITVVKLLYYLYENYIMNQLRPLSAILASLTLAACGGGAVSEPDPVTIAPPPAPVNPVAQSSNELEQLIRAASPDGTLDAFIMPRSDDYTNIPQDPNNTVTESKVRLGKFLYHETGLTTEGQTGMQGTWSCASCHHAAAGFKSGNAQGIGDGGVGFGVRGEMRMPNMDLDDVTIVDHQPIASPTILNVAYQDVMLWNGQFGNAEGSVNADIDPSVLSTEGTPKAANASGLSGVEVQVIAGSGVHRMNIGEGSILETNNEYIEMIGQVRDENEDVREVNLAELAALAIAAFERTVLANEAPFQQWLRGDREAMSHAEIEGAKVFFGKGQCSACHSGPALSSRIGASESEMFMSVGFADLDAYNVVHSEIPSDAPVRLGRGGLTGNPEDNYKFKIPPLYNLVQSDFLGHGNSFNSVRQVVEYKNNAIPENPMAENIDPRFVPLNLTDQEIDNLVAFIEGGLQDGNLERYVPERLPSGMCAVNNDDQSRIDLGCD